VDARTKRLLLYWAFLGVIAAAPDSSYVQAPTSAGSVSAIRGAGGGGGASIFFPGTEDGIRAALDTLRATGGTVTIAAGEYRITGPLTVWDRTKLQGRGKDTRLVGSCTSTERFQLLRVGSDCQVQDLSVVGPGYVKGDFTAYSGRGIVGGTDGKGGMNRSLIERCVLVGWNTTAIDLLPNSSGNTIRGNHITGSGWEGIYLAQYCDSNLVEENWIDSCRRNAIDVVGSFNLVRNNHISDIGLDSTSLAVDTDGIMIYSRATTTGIVRGNRVERNTIRNAYNGISVLAGIDSDDLDATILGNTISECRASGMRIGSKPTVPMQRICNIRIENNEIARCDSSGIYVEKIPQCVTIRRNHIYMNRSDGIRLVSVGNQVRGITITKNSIVSNGRRGIYVGPGACARVKHDNILEGNVEGPNGGANVGAASTR
jgi:parallel beta-helix repeat protein